MIKKLLSSAFILFFTTQVILLAQNGSDQNSSVSINFSQQQNIHFFLLNTKTGSMKGMSSTLKSAFSASPYISISVIEKKSRLKITAQKGTKIEDIKLILASFNIGCLNYQEAYSIAPPAFFTNH